LKILVYIRRSTIKFVISRCHGAGSSSYGAWSGAAAGGGYTHSEDPRDSSQQLFRSSAQMSTFSTLRSSRLEKQSKSYVRSEENHPNTPPASEFTEGKNTSYPDQTALYSLPSTLDVRASENAGRGLFAKSHFRPGAFLYSCVRAARRIPAIRRCRPLRKTIHCRTINPIFGKSLFDLLRSLNHKRSEKVYKLPHSLVLQFCECPILMI